MNPLSLATKGVICCGGAPGPTKARGGAIKFREEELRRPLILVKSVELEALKIERAERVIIKDIKLTD